MSSSKASSTVIEPLINEYQAEQLAALEKLNPDPAMTQPAFTRLVDCIGNTPLIRLNHLSDATGCEILGKAEFMNPGGSVKDRAALGIVRDAERRGTLRPGGIIVEGTAGNTGIGLAVVGNCLGYPTVIVMPDNQSKDKVDTLRAYGADVRLVPAVPFKDPNHFVHQSRRLAEELAKTAPHGAVWANQFDNIANRDFHEQTTAAEIWAQTGGSVDALHLLGRHRRHAGRHGARPQGPQSRHPHRPGRSARLGAVQLFHPRRTQGRGQFDQRRHRHQPDHGQLRRHADRRRVPDPGQRIDSAGLRH